MAVLRVGKNDQGIRVSQSMKSRRWKWGNFVYVIKVTDTNEHDVIEQHEVVTRNGANVLFVGLLSKYGCSEINMMQPGGRS